jgi:hypothetical protein
MAIKENKYNYFVLVGYLVLAAVFLGIGINFKFLSQSPMSGDPAFYMWSMKWIPYALTHGLNPFITNQVWGDIPYNLTTTSFVPALSLLLWPITSIFGVIFSYNFANILGLSLGSFGVYLLGLQWVDRKSSLVGSLVFFFSPYVWGQLIAHLNLSFVVAIPFLVLFFVLRMNGKLTRLKFILFSTLMLLIQFGISIEVFATFVFIATISFAIVFLFAIHNRNILKILIRTAIEQIVSMVLSMIILIPYLLLFFHDMPTGTFNPASMYSADIINFFIPTVINLLFGKHFVPISSQFTGNSSEQGTYLGIFLIVLAAGLFVRHAFYKKTENSGKIIVLLILFLVTVVFSLGPALHILQFNKQTILLPWNIIDRLPLIKNALPVRFSLYTDIIAALLIMFWFYETQKKIPVYIFTFLIILSLIPNPKVVYPPNVSIPTFFKNQEYKKAINKGDTVLIIPTYDQGGIPAFYQAISNFHFKIAEEMAGLPPEQIKQNPVTRLSDQNVSKSNFANYLKTLKIRNIIAVGEVSNFNSALLNSVGLNEATKYAGNVTVYTVDSKSLESICNSFTEITATGINFTDKGNSFEYNLVGFSGHEPWGTWSDAKESSLSFAIPKPLPSHAIMNIDFNAFVTPSHLQHFIFIFNGRKVFEGTYSDNKTYNISFDVSGYLQSENNLIIQIPDAETPKALGINDDNRYLGIGLVSLKLSFDSVKTKE